MNKKHIKTMNLEITLAQSVAQAIKKLYGADVDTEKIQLQKTRKEFEGDFTLVVFPFLGQMLTPRRYSCRRHARR